jgi:hypothetical protein
LVITFSANSSAITHPNLNVDCINLARRHLQMGGVGDIHVRQQPRKRNAQQPEQVEEKKRNKKSRQFLSIRATSSASTAFRESMFPRIHLCLRIHSFSPPAIVLLSPTPPSVGSLSGTTHFRGTVIEFPASAVYCKHPYIFTHC